MAAIDLYQVHVPFIFHGYVREMKQFLLCLLILPWLAGCNQPGPHFRDLPATRISVDGSVFDVRVRAEVAEAMRINPEYAPRFGPIKGRAAFAMEAVSGCKVIKVLGDQALATGVLACRDAGLAGQNALPAPYVLADAVLSSLHDPPVLKLVCNMDN